MNNKAKIIGIDLIAVFVLIVIDQITKGITLGKLAGNEPYVLWEGVFELHYLENRGAAFGMLQNGKIFFVFAAIVMLTVIAYVIYKIPTKKQYIPWHICLMLIAAGGVGNMIDRLRLDYVVDFFYFKLIDFPIFNVADIYVTIGTILLVFYLLFIWKEEDLTFLSAKKQDLIQKKDETEQIENK